MIYLPKKVLSLLEKKYNVLDVISFLEFDFDFDILKEKLEKIKKHEFADDDRIIIVHTDTDFYFEHCTVGVNLLNFFTVVDNVDIPKYLFIFYTNHFGLTKEIELVCKNKKDQPTVIESFLDDLSYSPRDYTDLDLSIDTIKHQALCMMHIHRSHRNAVYHALKDISNDNLVTAFTVK